MSGVRLVHVWCAPGARRVDTPPRYQFLPILATTVTPTLLGIEPDTLHMLQTLHHSYSFQLRVLDYKSHSPEEHTKKKHVDAQHSKGKGRAEVCQCLMEGCSTLMVEQG